MKIKIADTLADNIGGSRNMALRSALLRNFRLYQARIRKI